MTLTQVINGPDWNNAAASSPISAAEDHPGHLDIEPTPAASSHAKLTKLPRFIQNSTSPENLVTAVRIAFQKVVDDFPDHITKSERVRFHELVYNICMLIREYSHCRTLPHPSPSPQSNFV